MPKKEPLPPLSEASDLTLLTKLLQLTDLAKDAPAVAERLLQDYGSLSGVIDASRGLTILDYLTESAADLLIATALLLKPDRYAAVLNTTEEIAEYLFPYYQYLYTERAYLLLMDRDHRVIHTLLLGVGDASRVTVDLSTILRYSFGEEEMLGVLSHCHPSCNLTPSKADINMTRHTLELLAKSHIKLIDHLIFTENDYLSMAQQTDLWHSIES